MRFFLLSPAGFADTTWLNWGNRNWYDRNVWKEFWLTGALDVTDEGGHTANNRLSDNKRVFGYAGRFVTVAPYLGARYDFALNEDWTLTPSVGARSYLHDLYDDEWAPSAAVTLDYQEQVEFFVNGSRGVHYPGIYTRAVANDFAKGTLDAEVMEYVSGGTKFKIDEQTDVLLSLFHSEVSDRIDKTATSYINSGNLRATGVEWYVSVENFTNQHYEYYPGYPMAGAMIWTGVKLKF